MRGSPRRSPTNVCGGPGICLSTGTSSLELRAPAGSDRHRHRHRHHTPSAFAQVSLLSRAKTLAVPQVTLGCPALGDRILKARRQSNSTPEEQSTCSHRSAPETLSFTASEPRTLAQSGSGPGTRGLTSGSQGPGTWWVRREWLMDKQRTN